MKELDILTKRIPSRGSPVVAFIIGLAIVILASILNAAGLNLTKLDHVRTSAVPRANRRPDWARPLWLLGMILYILSQILGSTLALQYLRAEYVAPLGSSSLVFNFIFARYLVGTPVTWNDIYGSIVVLLGVIGIIAFGTINSGLSTETDVTHITYLWRRPGWLFFFFFMSFLLSCMLVFASSLDAILSARSDTSMQPFSGMDQSGAATSNIKLKRAWAQAMAWVRERLEIWSQPKDDKMLAWTLGIVWACCGGGLAGGTLVFAKATVNLLSGSLSHENPGNQFGHVAPIFQIIFLALTAVLQIICLNRGLKVYDSTLVVPVFYGVYTATGFLDSLIFNDQVDAYASWTLFLIFTSIIILIAGVVLLTHKKPEPVPALQLKAVSRGTRHRKAKGSETVPAAAIHEEGEGSALRPMAADELAEDDAYWEVGDASDEDDVDAAALTSSIRRKVIERGAHEEAKGLLTDDDRELSEVPKGVARVDSLV